MHIEQIMWQYRRDFRAVYRCEHCGATELGEGYDDAFYHARVVPELACAACGQTADKDTYRPLTTKYPEGMQV